MGSNVSSEFDFYSISLIAVRVTSEEFIEGDVTEALTEKLQAVEHSLILYA